jgi:hypothetical protein
VQRVVSLNFKQVAEPKKDYKPAGQIRGGSPGKRFDALGEHGSDNVDQEMGNHVGYKVASPQVKSRQNGP